MRLGHHCHRHDTAGRTDGLRFQKREKLGFVGLGNGTDDVHELGNLAIRVFGCDVMLKLQTIFIFLSK